MEKKINIAELLKDCPGGTELYCTMFDGLELDHIDVKSCYPIICRAKLRNGGYNIYAFNQYGHWNDHFNAKCVIFPKGKTTWEGFHRPFKDGDIVFYNDTIAIFKEWGDGTLFRTYVTKYLCRDSLIDINVPLFGKGIRREIRFATEEEKQKLFDAIKENGYKWNEKTKTLEKLIEPKFKAGDKIRHKETNKDDVYEISKVYADSYGLVGFTWMIYMKYQDDYELVPNKFDITTLKPFDKVLVRDNYKQEWVISLFSHCNGLEIYKYSCINGSGYSQCIPYEGNEHLLGKTDDCEDYYKTWE